MALAMGMGMLWIAGRELAMGRAEHVTLFFHKRRVYDRVSNPIAFWAWALCHGLGGLALALYGVMLL
jgi:hypothetical protein